ncbi:RNA-binding protein Pasilla isoform X1 [Chironomus tepperi]|uniref:RNA-binding protein Pasilla isoform X1 n=1 Tax=Chironomus tepperi TaxID=113505 RepID=UPI00391F03BB
MLHSNSSPPLQSILQRNCSPLKQQNSTMNGASNAQDSYFIFDELSTALSERNNNSDGSSKIIGNNSNNNFSNKSSSSIGSSIGGSNTSTATNLSSTFQRPQFNHQQQQVQQQQQQQRFGFGETATTYHFKTLVPSVAAGAIIGKGGETIASLQKDAGARVKMSKSHDFYPGTTERVCLISGNVDGILTVLDFIMDKIREKPDLTKPLNDADAKQQQERDKQVKILVPNSTAGMIIGKAGAYIKQIKEESGSYVQISQKPKDLTLQERCITIIGEKENNKKACRMILAKIMEDPSSGTCLNVSYADVSGPVANFNPTGSPYANPQISSSTASLNSALSPATVGNAAAAAAGLLVNGSALNLSLNLGSPNPNVNPTVTTQLLENIKLAMRSLGYSDSANTEVCAALGILAKYGVLGVGLSNGTHTTTSANPLSYLNVSGLEQQQSQQATVGNIFGAIGGNLESFINSQTQQQPRTSIERYDATFDPFRNAQATAPISLNNNFGLTATNASAAQALGAAQSLGALSKSPTPGEIGSKDAKNVEIPEVIVGAILGPGGRSLVEIQHISGANIQISKKGTFAPGTRNRIVTITGAPQAINTAHFLIEQRINEEETKRACQTKIANATTAAAAAGVLQ